MKRLLLTTLVMAAVAASGCSVNRALSKPSPKDLSFLSRGASRDAVRSELGEFTVSADSAQCDVHAYPEGSGGAKYARAFFYSLLDLGSVGIFEIFLNPIEASIGTEKVRTKACYNDRNLLVRASEFKRGGKETRLTLEPADDPALEASLDQPAPAPVPVAAAPVAVAPAEAAPAVVDAAAAPVSPAPAEAAPAASPEAPVAATSAEMQSASVAPVTASAATSQASAATEPAPAAAEVVPPAASTESVKPVEAKPATDAEVKSKPARKPSKKAKRG